MISIVVALFTGPRSVARDKSDWPLAAVVKVTADTIKKK